MKKSKSGRKNTVKKGKQALGTVVETDPECCAAHPLGCICCFCCLIQKIRKRKKKTKVDQENQLEVTNDKGLQVDLNFTPAVIEQPKPHHRHTV